MILGLAIPSCIPIISATKFELMNTEILTPIQVKFKSG